MERGWPIVVHARRSVSASIIPQAVSDYLNSGMRNRLKVVTGENRALLDQLRNGELDLVMGRLPAPENMQGLIFEPLFRDKVILVARAGHPLAKHKQFRVEALNRFPVLVPTRQSIIRPFVDRLFVEQGITEPEQVIETVSDAFGRRFVEDYQAIWIISRGVVSAEIESGRFVSLPVDTDSTIGSVGLSTKADAALTPATSYFADIIRKIVAESE